MSHYGLETGQTDELSNQCVSHVRCHVCEHVYAYVCQYTSLFACPYACLSARSGATSKKTFFFVMCDEKRESSISARHRPSPTALYRLDISSVSARHQTSDRLCTLHSAAAAVADCRPTRVAVCLPPSDRRTISVIAPSTAMAPNLQLSLVALSRQTTSSS